MLKIVVRSQIGTSRAIINVCKTRDARLRCEVQGVAEAVKACGGVAPIVVFGFVQQIGCNYRC